MVNWSLDNFPDKRRRDRRRGFNTAWTPILQNISCISEQSRAIQEVLWLIIHCRTMYCCWMTSPSTSTTSGTLTTCTPFSRTDWFQEEEVSKGTGSQCFAQLWTRCTPVKIWKKFNTIWTPRITVYKNTWRVHQHTVYWCNLAQRKGLQFYQTRSHAIALFNTPLAICFEKVVYIKIGEDVHCKLHQSTRLPRVVLTPNLQHGRQDPPDPEARKSTDHHSEQSLKYIETCRSRLRARREHLEENQRGKYKETCRGNVDCRIQGIPHSTVQKEDSKRKDIFFGKKLIQQFENHPNRDSSTEDLNKTEEFNRFSEKSKEFITSMGNTEYFEHCETSSKLQRLDWRTTSMGRPVARLMISSFNLRVSWRPVNPQECVWKKLYRKTMRTISKEKGTIHCSITIWYTIFPVPQAMKIPAAKTAVDKEWEKLEKIQAWDQTKVRNEKRWSMKQGRRAQKFILLHWWTSVIWKTLNWRQNTKNTKVELCSAVIL